MTRDRKIAWALFAVGFLALASTERAIAQIKKRVAQHGVATSLGTQNPMYASLAAPVFNRDGRLQFVISLIGVQKTFDFGASGEPARMLRSAAAEMSEKLGAVTGKIVTN